MDFQIVSNEKPQSEKWGVIGKLLSFCRRNFFKFTTLVLASTTLAGGLLAYRFYTALHAPVQTQAVEQTAPQKDITKDNAELAKIRTEFEAIAEIPAGEEPSVGQIVDVEQLKSQNPTFYADAKNGDAIFIYSKKAYIYRPAEHKLVNIAPVNRADTTKK